MLVLTQKYTSQTLALSKASVAHTALREIVTPVYQLHMLACVFAKLMSKKLQETVGIKMKTFSW